jgi:hypothetical protein
LSMPVVLARPLSLRIYPYVGRNTLALDDDHAIRMEDKVVDLCGVAVSLKPDAVEDQDVRIVAERATQVEGHLFYRLAPSSAKAIVGLGGIQILYNHNGAPFKAASA